LKRLAQEYLGEVGKPELEPEVAKIEALLKDAGPMDTGEMEAIATQRLRSGLTGTTFPWRAGSKTWA
jgi:hypothetical protein